MNYFGAAAGLCSNGLVISESRFEALRFRHAGLEPDEVVRASLRLMEFMPKVGERIQRFRERQLDSLSESVSLPA